MASTLSFRVEVAADQATQSLQVLSQAFNQAGITAKAALLKVGDGSKPVNAATTSLARLKEGANKGRESIMFLTSAMGELGAGGRAAQQAISGAAGALMVGGAAGAMLAAVEGVRLLVNVWQEVAGAEAEAKKRGDAYIKTISEGIPKAIERIKGLKTELSLSLAGDDKVAAFDVKADVERAKLNAALRAAEKAAAKGPDMSRLGEGQFAKARATLAASVLAAKSELASFEAKTAADRLNVIAEVAAAQLDAEKKRIDERERRETESRRRIDKLWWDNFNAQVAAEQRLIDAQEALLGKEMSAFHENVLGGTSGLGNIGFAGSVDVPSLVESQRAAQMGAQLKAIDASANEARDRSQELINSIAASWTSGLAEMLAATDLSSQNMARIFVQTMTQIIQQALPSQLGPFAGLFGGLALGFINHGRSARAGTIPSAAGGWWDTGSYEGLAYIHRREMVADEPLANAIRSGSSGAASGALTINVIGNLDGKGVYRTLTATDGDVSRAMRRMQRRRRA